MEKVKLLTGKFTLTFICRECKSTIKKGVNNG